ncbi:hypothetical protein J4234_06750 [Candidatus Woesearchaeota archaeon]|nr:hypothetical protein [Candidatus Woesearchaeota archaeon]
MKNLIFILMLFLTLQIAYAETKMFSGTLITDTDKVIDGATFTFKYDENSQKAFVQTPTTALIVENGGCKSNDIFRICINRANFSYKNITTYVYYYEVDAIIYKLTGSLNTSSKSILSTLLQGESTELTVVLTNPTDFEITNIDFNYDLTPFYITEAKGCELNYRLMEWKGSLQSKYDKTCTATIIAEKEGKYSLSGNLSYFNGFETEKKATDALAITVLPKQLKVNQSIDKNIEIKKPFYLNISLQNIHPSEYVNSVATITLPGHVSLIKDTPAFEKNERVLKHGLFLKPNASIHYSLYMEKLSEGTEPISLKFAYSIKGINDVIENSTFVDVISAQEVKLPEPTKEENKSNETTTNLTATNEVRIPQPTENKTTETNLEAGNKTVEQITVIDAQEQKPSSRNILLIIATSLIAFTIIILAVFRIKKRKKENEESLLLEKIKNRMDEQIK